MKHTIVWFVATIMLMAFAVPSSAAIQFDPHVALQDCGQKVVELGQEVEQVKDSKADAIAISVAIGVFIGSGGISALAPVIGGVLAAPFILLGF